jgi:orotidine-5'-phosphate decarboxylase
MSPPARPRVIVALDFANPMRALGLAERLDPHDCGLKVGKELFVTAGPDPVRWMVARGFNVFLDLKFHDIPNTVAQACAAATRLGVWMLNVHASGGRPMLKAARDAVAATAAEMGHARPLLVAVTVLTSLDQATLHETGIDLDAGRHVLRLAALARDCGLDGIVCSAIEAPSMRSAFGPNFALVTPGIRLPDSAKNDQSRITTPEMAAQGGADYLVIGRPITAAADPVAALADINGRLGNAA